MWLTLKRTVVLLSTLLVELIRKVVLILLEDSESSSHSGVFYVKDGLVVMYPAFQKRKLLMLMFRSPIHWVGLSKGTKRESSLKREELCLNDSCVNWQSTSSLLNQKNSRYLQDSQVKSRRYLIDYQNSHLCRSLKSTGSISKLTNNKTTQNLLDIETRSTHLQHSWKKLRATWR